MSDIVGKLFKAVIVLLVSGSLAGCSLGPPGAGGEPAKLSAWLTYWDLDEGERDLTRVANNLEKLCYFGAYFDQNDQAFIPEALRRKKSDLTTKTGKYEAYLTFVNDKQNADGSVALKDSEVLRRLFADERAMERHIDQIIALTLQGGFDGIEIDYERIWNDETIGQSFLRFADKLYGKARQNNLKLRLVLEPGTPFGSAGFFPGPEYVVMFYNLYGLHSEPGPKANPAFIRELLTGMNALPGEKAAAFSTGGCVWGDNGEKRFLTEVEAKTLAITYEREARRDDESQCLVFDYPDNGVWYQVWYADVQTLNYWIAIAKAQGVSQISLWRLGGNTDIDHLE